MLKVRLAAAGLVLAVLSALLMVFGGLGTAPVKTHPVSIVNFACVAAGNVGLCLGPPTADGMQRV